MTTQYHARNTMLTQDYQVLETITAKNLANVCAQFKYRGFIISFSTHNYGCGGCANHVLLMNDVCSMDKGDQPFNTVQDAIEAVDQYCDEQVKLDSF